MTSTTSTPSAWDNPNEGVQVPTWHPLGSATPSTHETLNEAYRRLLATDAIRLWLAAGGEYTILGDDWETSPTDQPSIALDDPTAPERITLAVEAANFFCKETWAGLADATMDMVDSERRANHTLHSYTCNDNTNTLQEAQIKSSATRILTTLNSLTRYPHGKLDNPPQQTIPTLHRTPANHLPQPKQQPQKRLGTPLRGLRAHHQLQSSHRSTSQLQTTMV